MDMAADVQVFTSVREVGQDAWDRLGNGRPFTSYRWYAFGERVLADCRPVYVIWSEGGKPAARGTFWLTRDEPLPVASRPVRSVLESFFRRWPLLVCRSPLSSSEGLILPEPARRETALKAISEAAFGELCREHGSFLLFDYLNEEETNFVGWPAASSTIVMDDPGTSLRLTWCDFQEFLMKNEHRMHQHYRRTSREAADLGIQITRHKSVEEIDRAIELIRNVERRHKSVQNRLARPILENMQMADSTWLAARRGSSLVGCLLLLEDNGGQFAFLPGLTYDEPCTYFMLLYEAIRNAFDRGITLLRWGNSAYEIKRRLGFELEDTNRVVYRGRGRLSQLAAQLAAQ